MIFNGFFKSKLENRKKYREKRTKLHKILVLGGFGYNNVGDEAQLDSVLIRLNRLFPEYIIKVLSPNPEDTFLTHDKCCTGLAPRVAFFRAGESFLYGIKDSSQCCGLVSKLANLIFQILFLLKSEWICFNSLLVKHDLPIFLISAQAAELLNEIRTSRIIYYGGGGYLTGTTLSRLWDYVLIAKIARINNIPIVLSGQTVGIWKHRFNIFYSRNSFAYASLITLRDLTESKADLKRLNINVQRCYPVCDDALFCTKEDSIGRIKKYLADSFIDEEIINEDYIVENIHDWGMDNDHTKDIILEQIHEINLRMNEMTGMKIIFIPMTPTDVNFMNRYNKKFKDNMIHILSYDYDYRIVRGMISKSKICLTMKHHPIIFSIGESVPCIAINYTEYYCHKNCGALSILGMKDFYLNIEETGYIEKLDKLLDIILSGYSEIVSAINDIIKKKNKLIEDFENELIQIVRS